MKVKAKVHTIKKPNKVKLKGYEKLMANGKASLSKRDLIDISEVLNYNNDNVNISQVGLDGILEYVITK